MGEYSSSTTSVDIIVPNVEYGAQYWVKILDTVTNSYIVENIYIHEFEYYRFCETCCDFSGGTSNFIAYDATPTPTPIPPTPTPTPTPIPPTPTPTPTPSQARLDWSLNSGTGGNLEVLDKNGSTLLDENSTFTQKSGTIYIDDTLLPYTITGSWAGGSGNIIRFRVCDITNAIQLYESGPIDNMVGSESFTVNPTPLHVSVNLTTNNTTPFICPE